MANLRVDKITSTETFEKTGSVQFDGNSDWLDIASSSDFAYGTGDFTWEAWFYPAAVKTTHYIFDHGNDGGIIQFHNGIIRYYNSTTGVNSILYTGGGTLDYSTWSHIAVSRNSGTSRLFVNGQLKCLGQDGHSYSAQAVTIGDYGANSGTNKAQGFISNARLVKGTALYTENFKPPMRELEVVPGTVLLCCQSKTDASLEKTGKTITVNGTAVASELTPGILTPIVKSGGGSAITGSVYFDGTGDYLSIPDSTDFTLGTGDFTIEFWRYRSRVTEVESYVTKYNNTNATQSFWFGSLSSGREDFAWYSGSSSYAIVSAADVAQSNEWGHLAAVRYNGDITVYLNGFAIGSDTSANAAASFNDDSNPLIIGGDNHNGSTFDFQGFISNLRVVKGTALYTGNFTPPTRELKNVPGTVLLCCQDENSITTEAIGKTITGYGDPAPSNFTPQVGDDRQITFEGVTKINTDAYFYLPTGDTASRTLNVATQASSSARGVFMGGLSSAPGSVQDVMDYVTITSTGDAVDFGNLTAATRISSSCSSTTRGVRMGGFSDPAAVDVIDYITIASTGNAQDFGNLSSAKHSIGGSANSTRGLSFGSSGLTNAIQFITISTTGDAQDFGDMVDGLGQVTGTASPTRCVMAGGESPTRLNTMQYVTIMSMGNAFDFGDLTIARSGIVSLSSATRGLYLGGELPASPSFTNTVDFVQIATTGNAINFGDLDNSNGMRLGATAASPTRGLYAGGGNDQPVSNTAFAKIHLFTIASTGDATDFGDITVARFQMNNGTVSSGHGGLG